MHKCLAAALGIPELRGERPVSRGLGPTRPERGRRWPADYAYDWAGQRDWMLWRSVFFDIGNLHQRVSFVMFTMS